MRAQEFITPQLREDIEDFPIANVRRPNGAIGNQGVNIEQAADVLTHAAGMQVSPDMSMRQLVDALKADPAAQQRLRQFVQKNPITVYALPDGSYHLQDGHHRTFLLNLLGDETVPAEVKENVTEAKTVEFEGLTLKVIKQDHELTVDALDEWGNKVLGHVKFNIGDGKELDPQDLRVDDKYQGQGIARVMYDYVKSLGYTINRSWDQTDAGAGFWNKHRGEDVRVWEQGVVEGKVKLYTDPSYFGAEVDDTGFDNLPIVNISANQLVGFEPDDKMNQPKSKANVEKIVAGLKQGAKLPPLLVRKYKNGYQVLDGHHRFWAYKLLGVKSIPSRIVPDEDIEEISKQGVAEARKNPEQNTKYQSGWAELAAWARKNNVWLKPHEWAISMTYVPKLGINPGPGISEDTPRGIYFYPFQWAYSVKMDKEALPWADNAPYIQLFQYSTGTELYDPNQIPLASAVAQLKNYGITDEDIAAEKENYPGISTYNLLVWCLGRKYDDNKRVTILNKVLRNLGYDYMIDNGKGWIAINEPTQGVVLNPKIIDKVVTFNNYTRKKEQGVAEGKITLSTDPNWYGATVDNYQASGPVVNIPANQLVGFEPDDKMNQPKSKANVEKIVAGLKKGDKLPPLLVRKYKKGYQVLDGHHRFWAYKLSGTKSIPVQIVPAKDIEEISKQGVAENFADGKNPGRKGLSKRVGVNTKASVSDLRKTAKNSSGEKQRMAHWLANMKAGRAKAKRK